MHSVNVTRLVFIMGCPRSGTTMLADMLGAAPGAIALQESHFKFTGVAGVTTLQQVQQLRRASDLKLWNVEERLDRIGQPMRDAEFYRAMIQSYVAKFGGDTPVRVAFDHTPVNARCAPLLAREFPDAKFIHIIRDGRAIYHSVKSLDWGPSTPIQAARWWCEWLSVPLALESVLDSGRVTRVFYSDLVREPERELARLADFAEIENAPDMAEGGGLLVSAYTAGNHRLVNSRPDPSRIDAWRTMLPQEEIDAFNWAAEGMLELFDYTDGSRSRPRPPSRRRRMQWQIEELIRNGLINRMRLRRRRRRMDDPLPRR